MFLATYCVNNRLPSMLANRHTPKAITNTTGCSLRNYHSHCNYPGNGRQSIENVDTDIPAERKPAKRFCRVMVSRVIGILGLHVCTVYVYVVCMCECVCVCVGGGGGGGRKKGMYKSERKGEGNGSIMPGLVNVN